LDGCLTVNNYWELLTGGDAGGFSALITFGRIIFRWHSSYSFLHRERHYHQMRGNANYIDTGLCYRHFYL